MNPLFLSHLVADFLLQPDWLVALKQKKVSGVMIHSGIHAAVLTLFLMERLAEALPVLIIITISHGLIDFAKISYQKRNASSVATFLIDQIAHFTVLILAAMIAPIHTIFWNAEEGAIVWFVLFTLSLGIGVWNIVHAKKPGALVSLRGAEPIPVLIVAAVFIVALIGAKGLAS